MAKKKLITKGDRNSKFFHAVVNACRNKSLVSSMKLQDGSVLDSLKAVHDRVVNYFSQVLSDDHDGDTPDLRYLFSSIITYENSAKLLAPPLEGELKVVVQSITTDSVLGINGFGLNFYLTCWDFIKDDLMEATTEFFTGATLPRFFTTSYIVLIFKVVNPTTYEKF